MKSYIITLYVLLFSIVSVSSVKADFTLVDKGTAMATIVVGTDAGDQAKEAAIELQTYIEKISGARLPIVNRYNAGHPQIVVGQKNSIVQNLRLSVPSGITRELKEEGYVISCKDNILVLAGNETPPYEGTYFAVYDFLGSLGCRWYMPDEFGEVVPKLKTIRVSEGTRLKKPIFRVRDLWLDGYILVDKDNKETKQLYKLWARRNRFSNHAMFCNPKEKQGAPFLQFPVDGAMNELVSWKKYGEKHPEYFAQKGDDRDHDVPVLSSPDVIRVASKTINSFFKENPVAMSYGFSGPDRAIGFSDERSRELAHNGYGGEGFGRLYGGLDGQNWHNDISDLYFGYFINHLSHNLMISNPDKWIVSLAYSNWQRPPEGIDKRWNNVIVTIAPLQSDPLRAIGDRHSPINRRYEAYIRRWSEIATGIIYYSYNPRDYTMIMRPCWQSEVIKSNMRLLKKLNAWGFTNETIIGAMMDGINLYLYGRLGWNIDIDTKQVIEEFCRLFFGPAAEPMRAYYNFMESTIVQTPSVPFWPGPDDPVLIAPFDKVTRQKCRKYLEQASTLAVTEPYHSRVSAFRQHFRRFNAYCEMHKSINNADFDRAIDFYKEMEDTAIQVNNKMVLAHKGQFDSIPERFLKLSEKLKHLVDGTEGELVYLFPEEAYFRMDPELEGLTFGWPRQIKLASDWEKIRLDKTWGAQGYQDTLGRSYHGVAWYKIVLDLTVDQVNGDLHLCLPGVYRDNNEIWLWVNGKLVDYKKTKFSKSTDLPLKDKLKAGRNYITIRINAAGGIYLRPFIYRKIDSTEG